MRAAHAQIAVVRAEYFPRISLTGLFGFASTELSSWLDATSRTWQAGGAVVGPLFNAGKTAHKVNGARAEEQAAIAAFKLTVVGALREVEDALVAVRTTQEELKMREQQVAAAHAYLHLAESRYAAGQSSYLEVLDAQRSQFQAEVELANVQAGTLAALVSLHKVMAGNL